MSDEKLTDSELGDATGGIVCDGCGKIIKEIGDGSCWSCGAPVPIIGGAGGNAGNAGNGGNGGNGGPV